MTERVEHFENIGQQKKSARYSIFRLTLRTIQNAGWRVIGIAFVLACLAIALDSALPSKPESNIQQSCSVAEQAAGRCVAESISTEATVDNVSGVEDKAQPVQKFLSQKGVLAEATLVPLLFAFFLILGSEYFLVRAFASRQKMSVPPASFKNFF